MAPADNHFCYVVAGFWVEIPEDSSRVDIYDLGDENNRGDEGRPHEFPRKVLSGRRAKAGDKEFAHPPTLLAARVWCRHARDLIKAEQQPDWDGDGLTAPSEPLALPAPADDSEQVATARGLARAESDAPAPSGDPTPPAPRQRKTKKG